MPWRVFEDGSDGESYVELKTRKAAIKHAEKQASAEKRSFIVWGPLPTGSRRQFAAEHITMWPGRRV